MSNFSFEGTISFSVDELNELIEPDLNQELSFGEIQKVINRIRNAYLEKGYFLTSVSIPEQEVVDGTIVVTINEGSLDRKPLIRLGNKLKNKRKSTHNIHGQSDERKGHANRVGKGYCEY